MVLDAYMGLMTVAKYDTDKCASECDKKSGCLAFNIYFEVFLSNPSTEQRILSQAARPLQGTRYRLHEP